jgi:polygalacturonase
MIQTAIDDAESTVDGQTLTVGDGTYNEDIAL